MIRSRLILWVCLSALFGGCQADFGAQTTPGEDPHSIAEIPAHGSFAGTWRVSGEEGEFALEFVIQCDGALSGERTDSNGTVHSLEGDVHGAAVQGVTSGESDEWTLVGLLHATSTGGAASGFWQGGDAAGTWHVLRVLDADVQECSGS